jgi:sigma-B regulation protein RsbU (phosphoserine phosphatase)
MTLLVVDPDDAAASALSESLSRLGFSISRISDVAGLPAALRKGRPELVLCPYLSNAAAPLGVAEAALGVDPTLPIAVIARGDVDKRVVIDAMRIGAVDVFESADLDAGGLAQRIDRAIGRGGRLARASGVAADDAQTRAQLREFQRDQRAGRYIQMGMLPPSPMAIDRYRLRHKLYPSLMLSGDFVDYFRITDRHFVFYIADVSGHGASSAFVTVLLKNFSRRLRREYRPKMLKAPGEILAALNRELLDNQLDKHVAVFVGVVDLADDSLAFANGGHFPPAILIDDDGARYLEVAGKPVGLFESATWESNRTELRGPVMLAMVSDGIFEQMGAIPLAAKEQRLLDAVKTARSQNVDLWNVLGLEQRRAGPDDVACLVITKEA